MVDVGFTGTVLEKKHCKYIPFYKDELAVITPDTPEYRILKEQNRDDIDWIKRKPLILREEGSGTRKEAEKQLKNAGISMEALDIVASIANQETIKKSVKQGMGGLRFFPDWQLRMKMACLYSRFRALMKDEISIWSIIKKLSDDKIGRPFYPDQEVYDIE